jgi:hypothetical protein
MVSRRLVRRFRIANCALIALLVPVIGRLDSDHGEIVQRRVLELDLGVYVLEGLLVLGQLREAFSVVCDDPFADVPRRSAGDRSRRAVVGATHPALSAGGPGTAPHASRT